MKKTYEELVTENRDLLMRLEETEEVLRAIRNQEVDALVVQGPEGDQVFTLHGAEHPYRIFVEEMNEGAVIIDHEGSILHCNQHLAELLKTPLNRIMGASLYDFIVPLDGQPLETILKTCRPEGCKGEFVLRAPHGYTTPINLSARPVLLNEIETFCAIITDISERKRADAELMKTYKNLETAIAERARIEDQLHQSQKMEAIGTLAGGIAHDFNNILAAIIGFSEMVEEDLPPGDPSINHMQRVINAATRGRDLVQQILAFSRKTEHARHPVSISLVAKETVQLLRASIPTSIEIILDNTATSDTILATPVEVQQILMNLATNASLAMHEQGGLLHVSITDVDLEPDSRVLQADMASGEYLQLVVSDTGTGMTPDVIDRIFEPFFTTRKLGQGTGMGLAVAYGIVKSLHGSITVESEPGVGSTFQVLFPKVTTEKRTETPLFEQSLTGAERVLFIDDEDFLIEWGQAFLERMGYEVTAMHDSTEALETFSSDPSRFDLVITDQTMPGITGLNLARELLKIRPDIPVILCSGYSDAVTLDTLKEAGVREYLMKPLAKKDLAEVIRRVLDKETKA